MPETLPAKKRKRSEEDVIELVQRYSAPTILSLLQEVCEYTSKHVDCIKIEWNALVKKTSTGISNAREYQMLWRHLAYHNPLLEKLEDDAEPLDDDSDLEFELEAVPDLNPEELAEVKEYTKVILSSASPHICASAPRPVAEASPNVGPSSDQALPDPPDKPTSSTCGGDMAVPVSIQKPPPPLTGPSAEGLDGNGSGTSGLPAKKKRQLWTKEEDMELIAAVKKCGEGNWANILKGDFKHNRTASQLSQRWALIRKRLGNSNSSNANKTNSSTRSEERLAAQKAFSLAVDMPITGGISAIFSGVPQMGSSSTSSAATSQASRACAAQSLNQFQDKGTTSLLFKARPTLKKPSISGKSLVGPNPSIQAAAFAAGGRIANPSTVASLFKAAQSKNAVHIRPGGGGSSLPISSTISNKPSSGSNSSGPQPTPRTQTTRPLSTQSTNASFGTTLSSQRSSQPENPLLASCTTAADLPSQQAPSDSKTEAIQSNNVLENVERKSNAGNDATDIDVEELLNEEVGVAAEMELPDAATKADQSCQSSSPSSKSQTVAKKEDQLQGEAPEQALAANTGGTKIHVEELMEVGEWNSNAATKTGQINHQSSVLNNNLAVVGKEDRLQNEVAPKQALVDNSGGIQIHAKELRRAEEQNSDSATKLGQMHHTSSLLCKNQIPVEKENHLQKKTAHNQVLLSVTGVNELKKSGEQSSDVETKTGQLHHSCSLRSTVVDKEKQMQSNITTNKSQSEVEKDSQMQKATTIKSQTAEKEYRLQKEADTTKSPTVVENDNQLEMEAGTSRSPTVVEKDKQLEKEAGTSKSTRVVEKVNQMEKAATPCKSKNVVQKEDLLQKEETKFDSHTVVERKNPMQEAITTKSQTMVEKGRQMQKEATASQSCNVIGKENQMQKEASTIESQTLIGKEDRLQKEVALDQALVGDTRGTPVHDKELRGSGAATDGHAGSQGTCNNQLEVDGPAN